MSSMVLCHYHSPHIQFRMEMLLNALVMCIYMYIFMYIYIYIITLFVSNSQTELQLGFGHSDFVPAQLQDMEDWAPHQTKKWMEKKHRKGGTWQPYIPCPYLSLCCNSVQLLTAVFSKASCNSCCCYLVRDSTIRVSHLPTEINNWQNGASVQEKLEWLMGLPQGLACACRKSPRGRRRVACGLLSTGQAPAHSSNLCLFGNARVITRSFQAFHSFF